MKTRFHLRCLPPMAMLLAGLIPCVPAAGTEAEILRGGESVFAQTESMLEGLREIMGFGPKRPVDLRTISKDEFRKLYRDQMRKERKPREVRNEVLFLKLFGLVPKDFDYEKTVLDLMSEQAWALYDFKRRRLYLADWAPKEALEFAMVHELVHAVDDQNFNLLKYVKGSRQAEQQLARLAVLEGQASWVMTEWVMQQSGRSLIDNRLMAITTASATRFEAQQFPVYERTPLYFREVLIFPYTDGFMFQHDLIERFGQDGFRRVFQRPPATTQQILQPELYLAGTDPAPPELPSATIPKGYKRVFDGTFGQLDHQILLEQHLGEGEFEDLLEKWHGSQFEVLERQNTGETMLRYAVRWADAETAGEYYRLYRQVCERKWDGLELVDRGDTRCESLAGRFRVMLEVDGDVVRSVEGVPPLGRGE